MRAKVLLLVVCLVAIPASAIDAGHSTPLESSNEGRPIVQVRINGQPTYFAVDTGAAVTVLDVRAAKRLGVKSEYTSYRARVVGGRGPLIQISRKAQFEVAGVSSDTFVFRVVDLGDSGKDELEHGGNPVGLLGSDWLHRNRAVIDYDRQLLLVP